MSNFNSYARRMDDAAKKVFSEYQEAETAFTAAESAKKNGPRIIHGGFQDAQEAVKAARLEANFREAKAALDAARRELPERGRQELQAIRAELVGALNSAFTIDPAQVDTAALELMKSGICGANDFEKLLADADRASNQTMLRLVASYAGKAYESARDSKVPADYAELARLYDVSQHGQSATESALLGAADAMAETFQRCMNNSGMIPHWDELMGDIIENF